MRLLRIDLSAQETRFLWVFSVRWFVYQDGETWFLEKAIISKKITAVRRREGKRKEV